MEAPTPRKSNRVPISLAAWFSALSTSWRSILLTMSKDGSAIRLTSSRGVLRECGVSGTSSRDPARSIGTATAGCPSGQRERSVKPPAQPTLVRTQHLPPRTRTALVQASPGGPCSHFGQGPFCCALPAPSRPALCTGPSCSELRRSAQPRRPLAGFPLTHPGDRPAGEADRDNGCQTKPAASELPLTALAPSPRPPPGPGPDRPRRRPCRAAVRHPVRARAGQGHGTASPRWNHTTHEAGHAWVRVDSPRWN